MIRFELETATFTEVNDDGFIGIQTDPYGDGSDATSHEEHFYGFIGRPCDPDDDGRGCYVLRGKDGSEHHCWFAHDPRSNAWLPRVTKGGSAQYGGQIGRSLSWLEIDGDTNSLTTYVPVAWGSDGLATAAHKLEIGVDGNDDPIMLLNHSEGMVVELLNGGVVIADATGNAYYEVRGGKININGTTKIVGGLEVGGTGGVEVPLHPALAAAVSTFATTVTSACSVLSGAAASFVDPGAKAAIPAFCTSLTAAVTALQSAVTAGKSTMLKTL